MSEIVRVMPKEPIKAERWEFFGEEVWVDMYGTPVGTPGRWVEVTEYVWDGTDGAFEAIRSALSGIADDVLAPNTDGVLRELVLLCHGGGVLSCTHGGRIQLVGDSFAILPPEVTP